MNISEPFILRSIATSLLMFAILLAGIFSYSLLPVSSLPEVEYPTMRVITFYPGASPDVVATSITAPLERQFGQMPGLDQMTSSSSSGASVITLQFDLTMSLDVAEQEVQAAINAANNFLPTNLPNPPVYSKVNPADTPILTLALTSKTLPLTQVEDYAETHLSQRISQQSGVGLVSVNGGQRPAVRIQANPTALSAYGLSLESLRASVMAANVNAAKGSFDGPRLAYTINSNDQLLTAAAYQPLIISYQNDSPVRVRDIANVIDGAENDLLAAWMNLEPAVIMNIQRQPGANVIAVVDSIKTLLPNLSLTMPREIDLSILSDRTVTIRSSIHDVQFELVLAVVLVVMVIFLFLRNISATIIPSISVPLSLVGTFGAMYLLGFSLNNLTLMALTIGSGFVVDDAIVMIENITRYLENGYSPFEAALKGAGQIAFTILSLTISLIAVLIPLLFMQDIIGRLFREFALTLAVAILISGFISLTLTPMLCSRLLKPEDPNKQSRFSKKLGQLMIDLTERYKSSLRFILDHQFWVLIFFMVTFFLSLFLFIYIPKGFFPIQDTGMIQGISEAAQSVSFHSMQEKQLALGKKILANPSVQNLSSFIGVDGTNTSLNSGRVQILLKPLSDRNKSASQVIQELTESLKEVPGITLYMQATQDLSIDTQVSRTQYQYSLGSPNADEVAKWSKLMLDKMKKIPELRDVASDQQNLGLQTYINIDRDTASRLGITAQMIDDTLYDAFGQRQISIMFTERNQYRVILEVLPKFQLAPDALNNIYINSTITSVSEPGNTLQTQTGGPVPFASFTSVSKRLGPLVIQRENQFPVATLSFNLATHAALGDAMNAISQAEKEIGMPESVETQFEGSAKIFQKSLQNEGFLLLAAIIAVYIILGVLYESYIHPITILSVLPSACLGALLTLLLFNFDLSVIALIGIILLIGIVMKNAIMMIDFALEQERFYEKNPQDAIFEAALLRFRPILMTTMAALLSAVPLAFGTGMGSELRNPLGAAIIGGLIVSQLLTIYTTPVLYLSFDRLSRSIFKRGGAKESIA